ncbi:SpoIIE family protein phosphatase [Streptomyces sp. NPDC002133]|uniref:SpoIIE family protein phosphatase n=1 Tax=Streptomyces sp. NPDC002133 TaxID=3154409 RepID=UPI0033280027
MEHFPTPPGEQPAQAGTPLEPPSAPTPTATVDEHGIVTGWSEGAQLLLGYEPSQVIGRPATLLLGDDIDQTAQQAARRQATGKDRWNGTVTLRHQDGRRLEHHLLAHHRVPIGSSTAEWVVVCAVTESGQPSEPGGPGQSSDRGGPGQLGESGELERLKEWAFAQSPCMLAVFDTDLRLIAANTGMEQALSLTEADMRGLRLPDIAPHPANEETEASMRQVLENGRPQSVQSFIGATSTTGTIGTAVTGPAVAGPERGRPVSLTALRDRAGRVRAVCLAAHQSHEEPSDRQRMQLLNEAGARIGTTLDIARTAQELADVAVPQLADFVAVDLLPQHGDQASVTPPAGPVTMRRAAVRSVLEGSPESLVAVGESSTYPALSPVAECLAQGRGALYEMTGPALARWAGEDPRAARIREWGTHSLMVVPLRAHGTTLGAALYSRHRHPQPFTPDDLDLAEQLTNRAALSIHNARRFTRERTTTMALQRSLLPQALPDQAALEIASRYLPATTQAGVGGDWFDVIPLSGARVALVVGDVVGHGIRASATMGRLRTAVRTLADVDLPPDELLTHLDDLVIHLSSDEATTDGAAETAAGIGTTCLYAVYDPITRCCTFARAGHPPPAVVTPDGSAYLLDVPAGPPLGLGGLPFETVETELPEGSLLALYTDGLLEPRDHDIDEALDKMFAALVRPAHTLDTICDRVLTAVLTHRPDDDIALLLARTLALHADRVAAWDLASDPAIVAQARKQATDQLAAWGLSHAAFITELVVSELVTNAIRYGKPPIQLRMIHHNSTLICEVTDTSSTTPHMRRARIHDEGGRGLLLVAQLAGRWGTRHTLTGKTIWAEQTLTT